jgi:hypothetical protein
VIRRSALVGLCTAFIAASLAVPGAMGSGRFFTLGFDGSDQTFVIRVREHRAIRELRADLEKPRSERRIVSGIVRRGRPYNEAWSFTMGPYTIVLGEAFIEVCDASPDYVESHRRDWRGQRWCPWSSYVEREIP